MHKTYGNVKLALFFVVCFLNQAYENNYSFLPYCIRTGRMQGN
jgi:hypothetical protein